MEKEEFLFCYFSYVQKIKLVCHLDIGLTIDIFLYNYFAQAFFKKLIPEYKIIH